MMNTHVSIVRNLALVGLSALLGVILSQASYAGPVPIVTLDPPTCGSVEYPYNGMIGWTFNLTQAITITHVGWYDHGADGLSQAYQVGLWQDLTGCFATGSAPAQLLGDPATGLTIPTGAASSLEGPWRVVALPAPLVLIPGNYQLAGLISETTTDVIEYVDSVDLCLDTVPGLTVGQFIWVPFHETGFQVTYQDHFYAWDGLELGPMLFVPEPCAMLLLALGLAAMVPRRRP